jgi:TonB family protein
MSRRDEARACYDKGLKEHPGIEGDLTVKFVIDPQGTVTEASVDSSKSTINEPSVGACVTDVIKKIKFAPSKGGFETRANYPFNFHPKTFGKADAGAK